MGKNMHPTGAEMPNFNKQLVYFVLVSLVFFAFPSHVLGQPQFENFGHWRVAAVHDPMDVTSNVMMRTTFASSERGAREGQNVEGSFGFRIFGGRLMTIDGPLSVGNNFWPYCDLDSSTYSINNSPPQLIATIENWGSCNAVPIDDELIQEFKRGEVARVRLNRVNGYISLKGFADAWERAKQFAR